MLCYIHDRITVYPDLCGGKPTIRGKRLTVQTILEFLAAGATPEEILELADTKACQQFAVKTALETLGHRIYLPEAA